MTNLVILSPHEQRQFDSPPMFNAEKRTLYFSLDKEILDFVKTLRTPINQVGFIIQLGYFRANGKFFTPQQFRSSDIDYVCKTIGIPPSTINITLYQEKASRGHRKKILEMLHWQPLNQIQQEQIKTHIRWHVPQQLSPKKVFLSLIDYCWHHKIELPSSYLLTIFITDAYNAIEGDLVHSITQKLTSKHREKLNQILGIGEIAPQQQMLRPPITLIKNINQSLRPRDIQENVKDFNLFKNYFHTFQSIIEDLSLSDQLTEYFAIWVQKATSFQLNQFPNKNKIYLHLLCYIKHQFYIRQDFLVDIFLKSVQTAVNGSQRKLEQDEKQNRSERNKTIKKLATTHKSSRELIEQITTILQLTNINPLNKLNRIEGLVNAYNTLSNADDQIQLVKFEQSLEKIGNDQLSFDSLGDISIKLQHRVSSILKSLEFNPKTSITNLIAAITYFRDCDGNLGSDVPRDFLTAKENEMCFKEEKLQVSLYKVLFFIHIANAIKSGKLNLLHSYRYQAIQHYLIDDKTWQEKRRDLLIAAGLEPFIDFNAVIAALKENLDGKYQKTNERFLNNQNPYLTIDEKNHLIIKTPKINSSEDKYPSTLLAQAGFVPIVKVLSDIDHVTQFTSAFKHHSIKHSKMKPLLEMILAGIIGKGCNIGINRLANTSVGINEDILNNVVNWHFSLKNIHAANNKVIKMINKLHLTTAFQHDLTSIHSSSDGRKVDVAVDSIMASHSYKYFGKGKGVTIYLFIDERQALFHSIVINSSEREAAYVIDGLLQNDVIKSDIHSTDTHGYTEIVFCIMHFLGIAFAPRLKDISSQKIYGLSGAKAYKKLNYKMLPSRTINLKLIEENWDNILRFIATIKLKYTSASQLLKRLSSYAKENPLYKALKEFGRIMKSIFVLTYLDDIELRQRIEKQLNKIEFANKFSKAVAYANNQEFQEGTKEELEIIAACNILIQNCVVLWNYLYLSQLIANNQNPEEQKKMFNSIARGSATNWKHINFQGEFDFIKHIAANQNTFDIEKILALKVA